MGLESARIRTRLPTVSPRPSHAVQAPGAGFLALALLLAALPAHAVELTARVSVLGSAARSGTGDAGHLPGHRTQALDQESLRLMLDGAGSTDEWSLHLKTFRQSFAGVRATSLDSNAPFRSHRLSGTWREHGGGTHTSRMGYDVDRAYYELRSRDLSLALGRQAVDWGSGRFWQPLNVFGAFAPTDLDTDYKPGIDAAVVEWFPSAFSALEVVYAPALDRALATSASAAAHYRRQVGDSSEVAVLAGSVLGNRVVGASFETDLAGLGWRVEGRHTSAGPGSWFWITGVDYQLEDGTAIAAEWYRNGAGATRGAELASVAGERAVRYGLQQHLGRDVLGLSVERNLTPLLTGTYLMLASPLEGAGDGTRVSTLHQVSFVYSLGNESDLLLSLLLATGRGVDAAGVPRSEFGHLPASATLRYRLYLQ